jgi:hypothetical protein
VHQRGLVHDQLVAADDVPHAHVVDRADRGQLLLGLEEGGREASHVADHHRGARPVAGGDDLVGLAQIQAHRLLHEHVEVLLERRRDGLGVVLVAVQDEDAVEAARGDHLRGVGVPVRNAVLVAHDRQEHR